MPRKAGHFSAENPGQISAEINTALADRLTDYLVDGHCPVSLVGDCLGSLPMLAALQRANIDVTLLWLVDRLGVSAPIGIARH